MTHAGAVFKPHLDALLHHLDDGIAAVSQLIDPDTGTVALGFQQSLGTWLVPDLARSFRDRAPAASASSSPRCATSRTRRPWTAGTPTLSSARGGRTPPDADVHTRLIALEPLRLALPREHPLAGQRRVRLADVAEGAVHQPAAASALRG